MSSYAQGTPPVEAPLQKVAALETEFKEIGEELDTTIDAIIIRAVFSERNEQEWNNLTRNVSEDMTFMQAVMCGDDITSEWLTKRDALAAQTNSLLKDASSIDQMIHQWLNKG